jgi:hypothetical protein
MGRLGELAAAADCTHIAWVASASNTVGMSFYRRVGATVVHQAGDAVTLQIDPAELSRTNGRAEPRAMADRPRE